MFIWQHLSSLNARSITNKTGYAATLDFSKVRDHEVFKQLVQAYEHLP